MVFHSESVGPESRSKELTQRALFVTLRNRCARSSRNVDFPVAFGPIRTLIGAHGTCVPSVRLSDLMRTLSLSAQKGRCRALRMASEHTRLVIFAYVRRCCQCEFLNSNAIVPASRWNANYYRTLPPTSPGFTSTSTLFPISLNFTTPLASSSPPMITTHGAFTRLALRICALSDRPS